MTTPRFLVAAVVPLLCAAGAQDNAAIERSELTAAIGLEPGLWTTVMVIESLEVEPLPGRPPVPAEALAAARSQIGRPESSEDCVTTPTPRTSDFLLPGVRIGTGCQVEIVEASRGRFRYRARCGDAGGFAAETSGEGTYTATSIDGRHRLSGTSSGPGVTLRSTARMTSRFEGRACRSPDPGA